MAGVITSNGTGGGVFSADATWAGAPPTAPASSSDGFTILDGDVVTMSASWDGDLICTVASGGTLNVTNSAELSITGGAGRLNVDGTLDVQDGTLTITSAVGSTWSATGAVWLGTGCTLTHTSAQISIAGSFYTYGSATTTDTNLGGLTGTIHLRGGSIVLAGSASILATGGAEIVVSAGTLVTGGNSSVRLYSGSKFVPKRRGAFGPIDNLEAYGTVAGPVRIGA